MECPFCQSQTAAHSKYCDVCGEPIPPGQHYLEESGVIEPGEDVAVAPPVAAKVRARRPENYRFARLGDRFLAFALDTMLLFGLFAVGDAWVFMRWGRVEATELQLTTASLLVALALNATVLFIYEWLCEASCGATLGKAIIGIRVVGTSQRGPLAACALRNLLRIVDGLGFYIIGMVTAACSPVRQRLGDIYACTAVIEESFGVPFRVAAFALWIGIIVGAGWGLPRICSSNRALRTPVLNHVLVRVGKSDRSFYFSLADISVNVQLASTTH